MRTSQSLDQTLRQLIESLINQFQAENLSGNPNESAPNVDEFISSVEQRLRSTLRSRLSQRGTDEPLAGDRTQAYTPSDPGAKSAGAPATARGDRDLTHDTMALATGHDVPVSIRSGGTPPDYRILGMLGKGGMGVVYRALHVPLNRIVAMKMILSGGYASTEQIVRFKREAEAAARLTHPNIVQVYDVGEHRGVPFFSLEYVEGDSMGAMLQKAALSDDRAAELLVQIARAVQFSHDRGILHRDLKPQNILITSAGIPKVADFGLAKRLEDDCIEQTHTGDVIGTPGYMAPEQARGEKSIGPRCDVYSLGAILYCVLTGRAPFVGPTPFETIRQVLAEEPLAPSRLQPKMNRDLETICLKALEKEPTKRYQSAAELADELQRVIDGQPILARPITNRERAWKWCKRNPKVASLTAVAAALLILLFAGGYIAAGVINTKKIAETTARQEADSNAQAAIEAEGIARENEALAEDQADLALDATRVVLYETQQFFKDKPQLKDLRQNMLDGILKEIERVYASKQDYDVKETFRASAIRQLGQIYCDAGMYEKALEKFLESEAIAKKIHAEGRMPRPEMNFSNLDLWIGDTFVKLGKYEDAKLRFQSMIEYRKRYFEIMKGISRTIAEQSLAQGYGRLGDVLRRLGQTTQAIELLQSSVDARQRWYKSNPKDLEKVEEFAGALGTLSLLYEQTGDIERALQLSEQALVLLNRSAGNKSDHPTLHNLAIGQRLVGRHRLILNQNTDANQMLDEAVKNFKRTLDLDPDHGGTQAKAAEAYYLLAIAQERSGQSGASSVQRGLELVDQVLKKSNNIDLHVLKLKVLAMAGRVAEMTKLADEIAADRSQPDRCLYAAIGYAIVATKPAAAEQRQSLLDKAIELVRVAVVDHGFDQFAMLRTDIDFAALQPLSEFQELVNKDVANVSQ